MSRSTFLPHVCCLALQPPKLEQPPCSRSAGEEAEGGGLFQEGHPNGDASRPVNLFGDFC